MREGGAAFPPRPEGRGLHAAILMTTRLRQRWLLAVLVAGQFMANVDIAIVNVATPSIHRDLHASGGALEFVVSGYVLAFAMLIITGARLGRIAGYRRGCPAGPAGVPPPPPRRRPPPRAPGPPPARGPPGGR